MYAIIGFASICKPIERSIPLILCFNFTDSCISANKIVENSKEKIFVPTLNGKLIIYEVIKMLRMRKIIGKIDLFLISHKCFYDGEL